MAVQPRMKSQLDGLFFSAKDVVVVFLHPGLHDALITMVFILVYLRRGSKLFFQVFLPFRCIG